MVVADALAVISAVLAVGLALPWVVQLIRRESDLSDELRDPVVGLFVPVIAITPMLLSTRLLDSFDDLGRTLVAIFAVLTLVGGLAVVSAWIIARVPLRSYHPGFYLPTAGGALLTAQSVTALGWVGLAQALFFIGLGSWLILGFLTTVRLRRTPLPPPLRPVVVIEIAAPALAGNTYLVVYDRFDGYALALVAVTVAMGFVQLALIPYYWHAPFGVAFWAGAFSYATTASLAMRWINHEEPTGAALWRTLTLTVSSGVVVLLSAATIVAVHRGRFFPRKAFVRAPPS